MLTGISLIQTLKDLFGNGQITLKDLSEAIQVSDLAENLGVSVDLVQSEDGWKLVGGSERSRPPHENLG